MKNKNTNTFVGVIVAVILVAVSLFLSGELSTANVVQFEGYQKVEYTGAKPIIDLMAGRMNSLNTEVVDMRQNITTFNSNIIQLNKNIEAMNAAVSVKLSEVEDTVGRLKTKLEAGEY